MAGFRKRAARSDPCCRSGTGVRSPLRPAALALAAQATGPFFRRALSGAQPAFMSACVRPSALAPESHAPARRATESTASGVSSAATEHNCTRGRSDAHGTNTCSGTLNSPRAAATGGPAIPRAARAGASDEGARDQASDVAVDAPVVRLPLDGDAGQWGGRLALRRRAAAPPKKPGEPVLDAPREGRFCSGVGAPASTFTTFTPMASTS